jgi:hypothetical protein
MTSVLLFGVGSHSKCCKLEFDFAKKSKVLKKNRSITMARPIEPTPVLEDNDAERFLDSVRNTEPVSDDRQRWMNELVQQSRIAERNRR